MDFLEQLQNQKKPTTYSWQQRALDMWKKLGVEGRPTSSFFKCFKQNATIASDVVYEISDADAKSPLKLFYFKFNGLLQHHR